MQEESSDGDNLMKEDNMLLGLGETQRSLLSALMFADQGMSIDEMAQELEVTRTAIRQHLANMEREQLVVRLGTRPTGRRPEQLYALSRRAKSLFPKQYSILANLLIEKFADKIGEQALRELMRDLGKDLAESTGLHNASIEEIAEQMNNAGYEVKLIASSAQQKEIRAYNCVFHNLAEAHPQVCELDLSFISTLAKKDVEHLECIVRGGTCCRFALKERVAS